MRLWLLIPVVFLWVVVASAQESQGRASLALQPAAAVALPDAPLLSPQAPALGPGRASLPPNGVAENYNSGPTINQREEDQSDDQLNPAVWKHHLIANRFWISGQSNFIFQAHGGFRSPYAGTNSFQSNVEQTALSRLVTLYTGVKLQRWTEFIFDVEEAGGKGLSEALGIAGFPNLDVVRNPTLSQNVYLARYIIHETIPVTADRVTEQPNPFYLQTSLPRRRIEFLMGKMSMVDFFDVNAVGSDSHLQFTNWAIDNNGAYDYAADTRGYTIAAILGYQGPNLAVRFGEALMPTVANGIDLDYALRRARAENVELDWDPRWFQGLETHIRPLAYLNHANMGDYRQAIDGYLAHIDKVPNIILYRHQGTLKQGFGINLEQQLPANFRAFFRAGWNEGHHESFAYTEMNDTVAFGADLSGDAWHRKDDRIGTAFETGGLSQDHREYLALGGLGFILGDGRLNYGRENVSETYYTLHVTGGLYLGAQLSFVANPGYNRDRGPVLIPGVRGHIDF
jgi:high affinity Mn2+ porin